MKRVTHFLRIVHRPLIGWLAIALVIAGVGIGLNLRDAQNRKEAERKALAALTKQQEAKSKQVAKTPTHFEGEGDTLFTDVSDSTFKAPSCGRLQNRAAVVILNATCNYKLRAVGKTTMAVVFIDTGYGVPTSTLSRNDPNDQNALSYANTYLKNQAKRYGVTDPPQIDMTFYGPYAATEQTVHLDYSGDSQQLMNVFQQTSQKNKVPEEKYDMVHYFILTSSYGGVAMPQEHRAFTYFNHGVYTLPVFVHETLHLFGATDKYRNNDCASKGQNDPFGRYNGSLPGEDIMCSNFNLNVSQVNDITAREIGWQN